MDGANGSSLVALLVEEEETLAGLSSPGSDVVGNIGDLVGLERADGLEVDGIGAEPEELLVVEEVPAEKSLGDCARTATDLRTARRLT